MHDFPFVCHLSRGLRGNAVCYATSPYAYSSSNESPLRDSRIILSTSRQEEEQDILTQGVMESQALQTSRAAAFTPPFPPVQLTLHIQLFPSQRTHSPVSAAGWLRPWYLTPSQLPFYLCGQQTIERTERDLYSCGHRLCCHSLQGCIAPVPMTSAIAMPLPSELYLIRRLVRCLCPCRSNDIYEKMRVVNVTNCEDLDALLLRVRI